MTQRTGWPWRATLLPATAIFLFINCTNPASHYTPPNPQLIKGQALYQVSCASCHQPGGQGLEGVAPPLAGTRWPSESTARLARIVLHGLRGPITVAGTEYNLEMPAMGFFADEDIAAILSYLRFTWGQPSKPVSPEAIRQIRAQTRDRADSWTLPELQELP